MTTDIQRKRDSMRSSELILPVAPGPIPRPSQYRTRSHRLGSSTLAASSRRRSSAATAAARRRSNGDPMMRRSSTKRLGNPMRKRTSLNKSFMEMTGDALNSSHLLLTPSTQLVPELFVETKDTTDDDDDLDTEIGMASMKETLQFGTSGDRCRWYFGLLCAAAAGLTFPGSAFALTTSLQTVGAGNTGDPNYLANVEFAAFLMMGLGYVHVTFFIFIV